ncbi:MAG: DPP IV N-terminal domain-containing protein, partial [Firmicutes bacterium]|nr:DPP IV N-terminal domain-containing protein [Bacillota bacterium]
MSILRFTAAACTAFMALSLAAQSSITFQKPPQAILDVFDVDLPPSPMIDAQSRTLALLTRPAYLSLADLAQPELRLAGLRLNPVTHNASRTRPFTAFSLQDLTTGRSVPLQGLPANLRFEYPSFSPTGAHFAFVEVQEKGLALWVAEVATGQARRLTEPRLSATLGRPYAWASDGQSLLVWMRPTLETYPEAQPLPVGPAVQEALGVKAPARTYQDLLRSPADEAKFAFYVTTTIHRVDLQGRATPLLPPAIYRSVQPSPDGAYLLVSEIRKPFSYQFPLERFPSVVRVVDGQGQPVATLHERPLQDRIPVDFDACEEGPRHFAWRQDRPATLTWLEAQDGGVPAKAVAMRDALYQLDPPFRGQ